MRTNVGKVDAVIRGGLAVACLCVAVIMNRDTVVSLSAALCAILFAATALTRHCPLYELFGRRTRAHPSHTQHH
ncbi:MAG: DUF2892 domain-containing protein [Gemmatimonadota bacterium]|nr:MAG: DUF2892 domain-containing protein [Gemmatimonadota bacterium]